MLLGSFVEEFDQQDDENNCTFPEGNTSPPPSDYVFGTNQSRLTTYGHQGAMQSQPSFDPRAPGRSQMGQHRAIRACSNL
jgi:hypothetical protein